MSFSTYWYVFRANDSTGTRPVGTARSLSGGTDGAHGIGDMEAAGTGWGLSFPASGFSSFVSCYRVCPPCLELGFYLVKRVAVTFLCDCNPI